MATTIYNKVKTGGVELSQLQAEINENSTIIPSCLSISTNERNGKRPHAGRF